MAERDAIAKSDAGLEVATFMSDNERFHGLVLELSGNSQLARLVSQMQLPTLQTAFFRTIDQKVRYGLRLCLAREPSRFEAQHLEQIFRQELARYQQNPTQAEAVVGKRSGKIDAAELAAWFHLANILLNLDETITRG